MEGVRAAGVGVSQKKVSGHRGIDLWRESTGGCSGFHSTDGKATSQGLGQAANTESILVPDLVNTELLPSIRYLLSTARITFYLLS